MEVYNKKSRSLTTDFAIEQNAHSKNYSRDHAQKLSPSGAASFMTAFTKSS
jgi:hypothetical protein